KMIERFLLDRIDAEARRTAVGGQHHRVALARTHEAQAALALVQLAIARAEVALDAAVVQAVPIAAGRAAAYLLIHGRTSLTYGILIISSGGAAAGDQQ